MLIGKYSIIESNAAIGNVRNQIKTILMLPLFLGACWALPKPINDATSMCEPDRGIPKIVPRNKIIAVGTCAAKPVEGLSSVIVPTFLMSGLASITIPAAKLTPERSNRTNIGILESSVAPTTIPTELETSLPLLEKAVKQITANKINANIFSALSNCLKPFSLLITYLCNNLYVINVIT